MVPTIEAIGGAEAPGRPGVFLWMQETPVPNGQLWQVGPMSPTEARQLAASILDAADDAERLAGMA